MKHLDSRIVTSIDHDDTKDEESLSSHPPVTNLTLWPNAKPRAHLPLSG